MPRPLTKPTRYSAVNQSTTLRGFTGGLNVTDDDMNLSYKFCVISDNIFSANDGTMQVRYGTSLFANCAAQLTGGVGGCTNMEYFNGSLIVVCSNGEIVRVLADGSQERIWDAGVAAALPGSPSAWSTTPFCSFAKFNGHLIICNGVDKPLDIDSNFIVEYLQDAATFTNINVPICRYVVACQRYLVMAGDPLFPNRVHISARDAAGTWFGDPPPNDATRTDVGSVVSGADIIRGIMSFRDKLLVLFAEGTVVGSLGIYDENGNHNPDFNDGIEGFGSIAHRSTVAVGDDGLMADLTGVPSIKRTVLSTSLKPENASDLVDPLITAAYGSLSLEQLEDNVFSIWDKKEGQYLLFVPNEDFTQRQVFVYSYRPKLRQEGWATFSGWNFTCGVRSLQGTIFFGDVDGKVWLYGSRDNVLTRDFIDTITVSPGNHPDGDPIIWELEQPWLDFGARDKVKNSKYISFDTRGVGEFTVKMYVDNLVRGGNGVLTPALVTEFSGGDQGGYGHGDQPYGGGRNTSRKKLYAWPAKFEIAKLNFSGSTENSNVIDKIVSITLKYNQGSIRP